MLKHGQELDLPDGGDGEALLLVVHPNLAAPTHKAQGHELGHSWWRARFSSTSSIRALDRRLGSRVCWAQQKEGLVLTGNACQIAEFAANGWVLL